MIINNDSFRIGRLDSGQISQEEDEKILKEVEPERLPRLRCTGHTHRNDLFVSQTTRKTHTERGVIKGIQTQQRGCSRFWRGSSTRPWSTHFQAEAIRPRQSHSEHKEYSMPSVDE
ncbi:hypothetical protein RUM43_001500 [Polyplax serrata]|uniref:Uncharacterized protein n=1 Tax=Polyplax serrata TaxID=468196 RepID=A0AAN8SEV7_POLSC